MPKKLSATEAWPTLVQERLAIWGKCIHAQRLQQRITGADLCARLEPVMNLKRREKRFY